MEYDDIISIRIGRGRAGEDVRTLYIYLTIEPCRRNNTVEQGAARM
jgi:hypothetical protein